jgi:hypothetical protein
MGKVDLCTAICDEHMPLSAPGCHRQEQVTCAVVLVSMILMSNTPRLTTHYFSCLEKKVGIFSHQNRPKNAKSRRADQTTINMLHFLQIFGCNFWNEPTIYKAGFEFVS